MLNSRAVRNASTADKPYKLYDERGLYLLVNKTGSKLWRFKYRYLKKEKVLAIGKFPELSLADARIYREEARTLLAKRIDPCDQRRAEKNALLIASAGTFRAVAEEWFDAGCPSSKRSKAGPSQETIRQLRLRLTKYLYPRIGHIPMMDIRISDVRAALVPITKARKNETAHRVRSLCDRIYRYAIQTERAERNIAADLQGSLAPAQTKGFAAITEGKAFGELLKAIHTSSVIPFLYSCS